MKKKLIPRCTVCVAEKKNGWRKVVYDGVNKVRGGNLCEYHYNLWKALGEPSISELVKKPTGERDLYRFPQPPDDWMECELCPYCVSYYREPVREAIAVNDGKQTSLYVVYSCPKCGCELSRHPLENV